MGLLAYDHRNTVSLAVRVTSCTGMAEVETYTRLRANREMLRQTPRVYQDSIVETRLGIEQGWLFVW